jgi:hypothetical protein
MLCSNEREPDIQVQTRLSNYDFSWARIVSDILSPPVVWATLSFPMAARVTDDTRQALLWASVYSFFVCILPVLYVAYMVKQGRITDIHIKVRSQRILPFIVTIACSLIAIALLLLLNAPPLIPMFAIFSMLQIVIMLVITTVWQISLHAMGITSAVVAIGALFGAGAGFLFAPFIGVVGAARIKLRRHTLAQVIAGGIVGGGMTLLLFLLVSPG